MSEGIIQKIMNQSNSQTFLKRLFDNLSYDYAVMIRDYYYQDIISKTQGLIEEIKNEYLGYSSQTNKKILIGGKK